MPGITTSTQGSLADALVAASRLPAEIGRAPDAGVVRGSGRKFIAVIHQKNRTASAIAGGRVGAANVELAKSGGVDSQTTKALLEEAGVRQKVKARIYLRPHRPGAGSSVSANTFARPDDPSSDGVIPSLDETLAEKVAARIQGVPSRQADKYLANFAAQQARRSEAELAAFVGVLSGPGHLAGDDGMQPPSAAERRTITAIHDARKRATEIRLVSEYLNELAHGDHGTPVSTNGTYQGHQDVDRVLDRLPPESLRTLHARLASNNKVAAKAAANPVSCALFKNLGAEVARDAWAASTVCTAIGKPLTPRQIDQAMRGAFAARQPGASYDAQAASDVAADLPRLTIGHYENLLLRQLRARAEKMLREKGIPFNDLSGIADAGMSERDYAGNVAQALRTALASDPPGDSAYRQIAGYPSDAEVRQRLATRLKQFPDADIRVAADRLLSGDAEAAERFKDAVEQHGAVPAQRQALGRQFAILREELASVLAEKYPKEYPGPAAQRVAAPGLKIDWDNRLPGAWQESPSGLRRAWRAVSRGSRRVLFSVFSSTSADHARLRDAYAQTVRAAREFIAATSRNTARDMPGQVEAARLRMQTAARMNQAGEPLPPVRIHGDLRAFNKSLDHLSRALERYKALCESPEGAVARSRLHLPGERGAILGAACRDALGKTPAEQVGLLADSVANPERAGALLEQQRIAATLAQMRGDGRSTIRRLLHPARRASRPSYGVSQTQSMMRHLSKAVQEEAAIRAYTVSLRELVGYLANERPPSNGSAAASALRHGHSPRLSGSPAQGAAPTEAGLRMLDTFWTLDQRFRPLERPPVSVPAASGPDLARDRYVGMALDRLSPAEYGLLQDSIYSLDRRVPIWLARSEPWLSAVRCFQGRIQLPDATRS